MPLYLMRGAAQLINADAKPEVATDIADIHCALTGAPPAFVIVFFLTEGASDVGAASALANMKSGPTDMPKIHIPN